MFDAEVEEHRGEVAAVDRFRSVAQHVVEAVVAMGLLVFVLLVFVHPFTVPSGRAEFSDEPSR